jgi:hypothetical protein
MLVMNITEMAIFNNRNQFVPQHAIHGNGISSVWMCVKCTLLGDEYQKLAHLQFGGGVTLQWIYKDVPHTLIMATGIYVTKKRCSF